MADRKLLGVGAIGTAITAICCFTPALVLLLGAIGLAAWLAWLDYVLFPVLFLFVGLTVFALVRRTADPTAADRESYGTPEEH